MILIPFGFTASSGGAIPTNSVAPLVVIVDPETREIAYTAGTWNNADTVSFAWFMNNVEQVGEVVTGGLTKQIIIGYPGGTGVGFLYGVIEFDTPQLISPKQVLQFSAWIRILPDIPTVTS